MNQVNSHKILLYYKYTPIVDPEALRDSQKTLCQELNLKGRILISEEGINGTVAGSENDISEYIKKTSKISELVDMEWKISWANEQVFPKLKVVVRDEIVTLGIKKTGQDVSIIEKAEYIEPHELLALYENNKDFVIIDARNDYEATVGKFKNAIISPIDNFRDFPAFVKSLEQYKDKDVVTYCTGGVRCEKASAYLRQQGFQKVRQLHGGIHEYGEQTGGKHFEGEMFVFDKRLHVPVNTVNPTIISTCVYCHTPITRYIDCAVKSCPSLFVCCNKCEVQHNGACSSDCEEILSVK
jgi:UPF0176 protein